MKKRIGLIAFVIMIIVSIVSIDSILAKENDFSLTNAEVGEKTETVTSNDFSYEGNSVISDVTFHKLGDYVTYKLVLKNTSDETLIIKSITDDNSDRNVIYSYDSNKGVKIKSGNTLTLFVKAKYSKGETDTSKRTKKLSTTFTINYVDSSGKSGSSTIDVNPGTGDKIMLFSGLLVSSLLVILVVLINKKKKVNKKTATLLMILSLVLPIGVSAASGYNISFTSTYKLMDKVVVTIDVDGTKTKKVLDYNTKLSMDEPSKAGMKFVRWETQDGDEFDISKPLKEDISIKAVFEEKMPYLQTGKELIFKIYRLGGSTDPGWDDRYDEIYDGSNTLNVTKIKQATKSQYEEVKDTLTSDDNIISTNDSNVQVYAWNGGHGIIYYYADADKIYMNEDSSHIFENLHDLIEIDLDAFDTSKVKNMEKMFYSAESLPTIDVSGFDTSKVTNMSYMFYELRSATSLDLSNFDTSNVTDMSFLFDNCDSLANLDISHFNTSNVITMFAMFRSTPALKSVNVSHFDTGSVTNMSNMFANVGLLSVDLSSFDTDNVTEMEHMFYSSYYLTTVDITGFDMSKVENSSGMFSYDNSLTTIYADSNFSLLSNCYSRSMFYGCTSLVGGAGTVYNASKVDGEYARIDDPDNGNPGYFTQK